MSRRFIGVMVAFLLGLSGLTIGSPASAGINYDCVNKMDRTEHTFSDENKDVFVQGSVLYKYCTYPGRRPYVKPFRAVNTYNAEGGYMNCAPASRYLDGVTFNWYFWRADTGQNFNPGGVTVTCDESTMNTVSQSWKLSDVPRLYYGANWYEHPRWKVNVELERNFTTNKNWAYGQGFAPGS